jgi:ribosomal protein S18 acetylase RimI-like enzyme
VIVVRDAQPKDAAAVARVNVETWRSTYRGIAPDSFLDALSVERASPFWGEVLTREGGTDLVFVAEGDGGEVVGFAWAAVPADEPGYGSELRALYVLVDHQGRGIGRSLVRAVAGRLADDGVGSMMLWVFAANPVHGFYEALGGRLLRTGLFDRFGWVVDAMVYGWQDTADLRALAEGKTPPAR